MVKTDKDVQIVNVVAPPPEVIVIDSSQDQPSSDDELPDLMPATPDNRNEVESDASSPVPPSDGEDLPAYEGSETESAEDSAFEPESPLYQNQEDSPVVQQDIYENKMNCK